MKKDHTEIVTPFDWRRYSASASAGGAERATKPAKKRLTVQERIARIMAPRWGNPYCKPVASGRVS